ncbi:MAG: DUF6629 family protein [Acidimicrobiia bacterium]
MCFSAEADFVGAAVVGAIGVATLTEPHSRRELPLAALPLGFAAHQAAEGFVWLDLEGHLPASAGRVALYAYVLYAWALLPLLVPLSILLVEPLRSRRRWIGALLAIGAAVGLYLTWAMTDDGIAARISGHTLEYTGAGAHADLVTVLYVIATCGAFLISSHRRIVIFGALNLSAVVFLAWVRADAVTSLWCAWAAVASLLVYFHFARRREPATVPEEVPVYRR